MSTSRSMAFRVRTVRDLRRQGIPSVPMLGRYDYSRAMDGLTQHRHKGAIEICYLARGRQSYYVGGRHFGLRGGDIFLTLPDETHSTGGEPQQKGILYWMTLRNPKVTADSLLGLPENESQTLWKTLAQTERRHFPGTPDIKSHWDAALSLLPTPASPLFRISLANHLIALLLAVIRARDLALKEDLADPFQGVRAHVATHLDQPEELQVEILARIAGLSTSRFKTRFKEETGIPPAEYALRARIEEATRRLAHPRMSVTRVAFDLGFSSSQYFSSVFKRFTNSIPSKARGSGEPHKPAWDRHLSPTGRH